MSMDRLFGIIISNVESTLRLLSKRMIVAHAVAVPASIGVLSYKHACCTLQGDSNFASTLP